MGRDRDELRALSFAAVAADGTPGGYYEMAADMKLPRVDNKVEEDLARKQTAIPAGGLGSDAPSPGNPHIIRSADGKAALWAGAVDDIWQLGKPRGTGGPWKDSTVQANQPSDPYLMTAYDSKSLTLGADKEVAVTAEVDVTGDGNWAVYRTFDVKPGVPTSHVFPESFSAYWIRFKPSISCRASATLDYR